MSDWIGSSPRTLDELAAFDAMRAFLEAYWKRGGEVSEDLAVLLSALDRDIWSDGGPGDPAMWPDWRKAVDATLAGDK